MSEPEEIVKFLGRKKGGPTFIRIGRVSVGPGVHEALTAAGVTLGGLLERHRVGDWGMADEEEWERQDWWARERGKATSDFMIWIDGRARSVWITTEGRETTVLLVPN